MCDEGTCNVEVCHAYRCTLLRRSIGVNFLRVRVVRFYSSRESSRCFPALRERRRPFDGDEPPKCCCLLGGMFASCLLSTVQRLSPISLISWLVSPYIVSFYRVDVSVLSSASLVRVHVCLCTPARVRRQIGVDGIALRVVLRTGSWGLKRKCVGQRF